MKLLVCILVLLCCQSNYNLLAKADTSAIKNLQSAEKARLRAVIDSLIDYDLKENRDRIILLSSNLSEEDKNKLYNSNKVEPGLQIFFNTFPGFGIGSFLDKRNGLGVACLLMDAGSFAIMITTIEVPSFGQETKHSDSNSNKRIAGSLFLLSKIIGIVVPIADANHYNPMLKNALQYNQKQKVENEAKLSLEPYFCFSEFFDYRIGMQLVIRL